MFYFHEVKERKFFHARKNKTAFIHFVGGTYDILIFGSSRVNQISTKKINALNIYNFGLRDARPEELGPYLSFVLNSLSASPPSRIVIGLDFFGSNLLRPQWNEHLAPQVYINELNEPFFRLRGLLNRNAFFRSINHLLWQQAENKKNGVAEKWTFKNYDYYDEVYGNYTYNPNLSKI